jgi:tetratricopeptide (TPR) repeat protein
MYILVPLALVVVSFIGIGMIVSRKLPYLKKLTPESHEFGPSIFHDFFPELFAAVGRAHLEQYLAVTSRELEKLIRKVRLMFSRIDSASSSLITELRNMSAKRSAPAVETSETMQSEITSTVPSVDPHIEVHPRKAAPGMVELKSREQQLIIDIAQHPKNAELYAMLGEIYIQMNSFEDAKESFEAAIELDAARHSYKHRLEFVLKRLHETKIGF